MSEPLSLERLLTKRVRVLLEASLSDPDTASWARIRLEDVQLNEEPPAVVMTFRDAPRPECLFGFRFPITFVEDVGPLTDNNLEFWAGVIVVNLDESIQAVGHGLPDDCSPSEITWIAEE